MKIADGDGLYFTASPRGQYSIKNVIFYENHVNVRKPVGWFN